MEAFRQLLYMINYFASDFADDSDYATIILAREQYGRMEEKEKMGGRKACKSRVARSLYS